MSRQPRVDTAVRQQVYSYVETPIELNAPGLRAQQPTQSIPAQNATAHEAQLPSTSTPQPPLQAQQQGNPANVATQELEQARMMLMQERQAFSPTGTPLPEHPALSAPYEEGTIHRTNTPAHSSSQYPSYQTPPYSPGALPEKTQPPGQQLEPTPARKISVTPDTNPLQSPTSPIHRMGTFPSSHHGSQPAQDSFSGHQPGQVVHPNQIVNGGYWSTGLCECSDAGTCFLGLICPCMLYGRTQYRLLRKSRGEDPTNLLGHEFCNGSCASCACLSIICGCQCILATIQHTRTREAYNIEGNICSDCVRASCCMCCTFIRNEREIKRREETRAYSAQLAGSTFTTPYMPPGQMQYPSSHG